MHPNSQILGATNSAITEKVPPTLERGMQENGYGTKVDFRSSGLHRHPEVEISCKLRENCSKMDVNQYNQNHHNWEKSVASQKSFFGGDKSFSVFAQDLAA